jgi:hypothetical protein
MNSNASRFSFPPQLPPKAALALFDCLTDLVDAVWQHYESVILDQIMRELNTPPMMGPSFLSILMMTSLFDLPSQFLTHTGKLKPMDDRPLAWIALVTLIYRENKDINYCVHAQGSCVNRRNPRCPAKKARRGGVSYNREWEMET